MVAVEIGGLEAGAGEARVVRVQVHSHWCMEEVIKMRESGDWAVKASSSKISRLVRFD